MKFHITEVSSTHDALVVLGLKTLLSAAGIEVEAPAGIDLGGGMLAGNNRSPVPLGGPKRPKDQKRAAPAPAPDGRGSKRDCVRAALKGAPKTIDRLLVEVQKTFPEIDRNYLGLVLCQLSMSGECSLGEDRFWRAAA